MIRIVTGQYVDIWNLKPEDVNIEAIATSLGNQCRYAGHIRHHYSVAEHSIMVAMWVQHRKPEWALEALLHDAAESFLVDVPRPVKYELTQYRELEQKVEDQLFPLLNLKYPFDPIVKQADDHILDEEWKYMILGDRRAMWKPETAASMFIEMYEDLSAIRKENEAHKKATAAS